MDILAKGIIVGFGVLGPAIGVAIIFAKSIEGMARNPEASGKIVPFMFVGAGMVELFGLAAIGLFFTL